MRISVIGNSDTTGQKLASRDLSWPMLVQERLSAELEREVTVDSWRFAPYRPGAVEFAMNLVREAQPDVVIYTLATFWCGFTTVQSRVEQRFGKRVASLTSRAERSYVRRFEPPKPGNKAPRPTISRRLARKVIGAAPIMSYERYLDTVSDLIRELARLENTQVLVMADHQFNETARKAMPNLIRTIERVNAVIEPMVLERRMLWGSVEDALQVGGRRDEMIMSDCVHVTEEGHERMTTALLPVLTKLAVTV